VRIYYYLDGVIYRMKKKKEKYDIKLKVKSTLNNLLKIAINTKPIPIKKKNGKK
jgi:hypothetical protein